MRVRTDVPAVAKLFDYVVPPQWRDDVVVGTRVRVALHGRRVGGWVVDNDVIPPPGIALQPLRNWSGWGPPPPLVDLADWAAWRWAGPASFFLGVASPPGVVRSLPAQPEAPGSAGTRHELVDRAVSAGGTSVLRLPPNYDLIEIVTALADDPSVMARPGGLLVLVPSVGWAERLTGRLRRRGYRATGDWAEARAGWPIVVGSRSAAWTPLPELAAAVILDAHDQSYQEGSTPTYSAVEVVMERARRAGCPCLLTSPVPTATISIGRATTALPAGVEEAGWSSVECVDRRGADPRTGLFSEEFVRLAHAVLDQPDGRGPLVCVFNRKGRARLLACRHCGELARCTRCGAAVEPHEAGLRCPRCEQERPTVCAACGRLRMKTLRSGVTRLREEVAALLGADVEEVSGGSVDTDAPTAPVLIGTEAVLHRVRRAAAVVFLDIDLHLLAPRSSATDETLALLVRASRLVGPRHTGPESARVLVQTRVPEHRVLGAAVRGEPALVLAEEEAIRRLTGLPPFAALATVSGPLAAAHAAALREAAPDAEVTVSQLAEDRYVVRAPDHESLCDLLARLPRPPGRGLRIAVDPASV